MSLSIHRRTGHGRALLLSVVCAERNKNELRLNGKNNKLRLHYMVLKYIALLEGWLYKRV